MHTQYRDKVIQCPGKDAKCCPFPPSGVVDGVGLIAIHTAHQFYHLLAVCLNTNILLLLAVHMLQQNVNSMSFLASVDAVEHMINATLRGHFPTMCNTHSSIAIIWSNCACQTPWKATLAWITLEDFTALINEPVALGLTFVCFKSA